MSFEIQKRIDRLVEVIVNRTRLFKLKGQCHEILDTFFGSKDSTSTPDEQAKRFHEL